MHMIRVTSRATQITRFSHWAFILTKTSILTLIAMQHRMAKAVVVAPMTATTVNSSTTTSLETLPSFTVKTTRETRVHTTTETTGTLTMRDQVGALVMGTHPRHQRGMRPTTQWHRRVGKAVVVAPMSTTTVASPTTTTANVDRLPSSGTIKTTRRTTTTVDTTTETEGGSLLMMRDQVGALAVGTHPRCGAACPLRRLLVSTVVSATSGHATTDCGILVVRLVWAWLWSRSRFFSVQFNAKSSKYTIVVTFGVSMVLLTLTHEMRWWAPRSHEDVIGANQHFLIVDCWRESTAGEEFHVYHLRDMATGRRRFLSDSRSMPNGNYQTNGKWFVGSDTCSRRELVVIKLPLTRLETGSPELNPTVVKLIQSDCWKLEFDKLCEDRLLLCLYDSLVLVDISQTHSLKKLVVLSVTAPQVKDLDFSVADTSVFTPHSFVTVDSQCCWTFIQEGTGQVQCKSENSVWVTHISPVNQSEYCVFGDSKHKYEVWDINDFTTPKRRMRCLPECNSHDAFFEGGLLFQLTKSGRKMFVTEECSGANVITFEFLRDSSKHTIVVTFGVSMVLLTLTHEMRWWIPRTHEEIIGANQHFLIVGTVRGFYTVAAPRTGFPCDFHVYYLQDIATGRRIFLSDENRPDGEIQTNGKWLVFSDTSSKELVVIKLPLTGLGTANSLEISATGVTLPGDYLCRIHFDQNCEDHLLLCFDDSLLLVDIAQTHSLEKLAVLSRTVLQSDLDMTDTEVCILTKQDGTHSFITVYDGDTVCAIEEGTGKVQSKSEDSVSPMHVSPVSQSEYCVFGYSEHKYQVLDVDDFTTPKRRMRCPPVWDINDLTTPKRRMRCLPECSAHDAFVEGSLLFQITKSGREVFVTEECSGVNVITLKFLRPVAIEPGYFSLFLSGNTL
ncbi:hypothetical protein Pelo_4902 [Pelomyxa schiedti]|nr:hypothetical protein Pelo_4902 [Pelomyxa schiedti]